MTNILKLLAGTAAIPGLAAPAAAQYYPQPTYSQQTYQQSYPQQGYAYPQQGYAYPQQGYAYPQQGYQQQQGGIAGIISQLLGNNSSYSGTDRTAVAQCASAAQAKAAARYSPNGYAYGQQDRGYNQAYATPRVTGITNVERRYNRSLRVSGVMSSGMASAYGNQGYGQAYNQGYANQTNDLTFRCNVDYRGVVTNVKIYSASAYRR